MPVVEMIVDSFQYPENPAWSVQTDEAEQLVDGMRNVARIWPLIRVIQLFSPPMRDLLQGYLWEEDGQIVGQGTHESLIKSNPTYQRLYRRHWAEGRGEHHDTDSTSH